MREPLIFDIKRYAINDGPGIRIVIFIKGCNLNCAWCHNPEGISPEQERMYHVSKCIKCGECVKACPENSLKLTDGGIISDPQTCRLTGNCAIICPTRAIVLSGNTMTADHIMAEILKERIFFDQSGGGVTFSGGEPLLYPEFLTRLLIECGKLGIHRAVDTAGLINTDVLLNIAGFTDLFLYDLKMMDAERHKIWTGVSNEKILNNLIALSATGARINIRIPFIGEVNDDESNLKASAAFIASLPGEKKDVNLLPYHKIAQSKYQRLGRPEDFLLMNEPSAESKQQAIEIFGEFGLKATIGG
jgi:pyruvate formate lyase activating enzyme